MFDPRTIVQNLRPRPPSVETLRVVMHGLDGLAVVAPTVH